MININTIKTVDDFRSLFAFCLGEISCHYNKTQDELASELDAEPRTFRKWYAEESTPNGYVVFKLFSLYGDYLKSEFGIDLSSSLD